jgi:MOSC domain-containing protein YiiM
VPGRLIGIARATEKMAPLELMDDATVSVEAGIGGDVRGRKPGRQVTVLFREGWEDAFRDLGTPALPWTARRANLCVEDLDWPREVGLRLRIGEVVLEVTEETKPCALMEQTQAGLRAAMKPDWRGGVCCNVLEGGVIRSGDRVEALKAPRDALVSPG